MTASPGEDAAAAVECLVIGGGPAGLTAAIYLARFHLSVTVIDAGRSRAAQIPLTRNHAGFPEGIAGPELLGRMRAQALRFGARIVTGEVSALAQQQCGFVATFGGERIAARRVLLATGVVNRRPAMDGDRHDVAVARGLIRYCPICDGYEVTDRNVAVLGTGTRGCDEALFLRAYTSRVTLISPTAAHDLNQAEADRLRTANIRLLDGPGHVAELSELGITVQSAEGCDTFDTLYPALGSDVRSELVRPLGATLSEAGCIIVDTHQRTSVEGLYAAGDVVLGLDQISHAMGEGGVAATTMRNDQADRKPLLRG